MCHANYEKRKITNDGRNITTKSRKKSERSEKRNLQILGNIGNRYHQTCG